MNREEAFNQYKTLLFSIAYRMLGSVMDAEDVVQEAYLRWHRLPENEDVASPKAYLSTVVTRLCLDQLRSAKARREVYVGPWLPEPLVTAPGSELTERAELADSLSLAFLVLLESLTPNERAAFLLREVFGYEYSEIAHIVDKSEANCRQMVRRAQQHLAARRPRYPVSAEQQLRLTNQFLQACNSGDMQGLIALLSDDIVLYSDGGGKVAAARNPIYGPSPVARFVFGVLSKLPAGFTAELTEVNGQPAFIGQGGGQLFVMAFDFDSDHIRGLQLVVNPDKLQALQIRR